MGIADLTQWQTQRLVELQLTGSEVESASAKLLLRDLHYPESQLQRVLAVYYELGARRQPLCDQQQSRIINLLNLAYTHCFTFLVVARE